MRIRGNFTVRGNAVSACKFDFAADRSLHRTGNGRYILAPVVHVTQQADSSVQVDSNNNVAVSGGSVAVDTEVGMNEKGDVGAGLAIAPEANVVINGDAITVASTIGGSGNASQPENPGVSEGKKIRVGSG